MHADILDVDYKMYSVGNAPMSTRVSPRLQTSLRDDRNGDDDGLGHPN